MSNLIDKIKCHIKKFKDCTIDEKQKILKLLTIAFGSDNDPFLLDNSIVIMFFLQNIFSWCSFRIRKLLFS